MAYTLRIQGSEPQLSIKKFSILERKQQYAKRVERVPYTDEWFSVGDGRPVPTPYGITVTIGGATQDVAIAAQTTLHKACLGATAILIDSSSGSTYSYLVDGIVAFSSSPRIIGYNITIEFALLSSLATETQSGSYIGDVFI